MKLLKYRFTADCPYPAIEGEIADEKGEKGYVVISLCSTAPLAEVAEDGVCVYNCPSDKVDHNNADDFYREDFCAFKPAVWNGFKEAERSELIPASGTFGPWTVCDLPVA